MKKKYVYRTDVDWLRLIVAVGAGIAVIYLWSINFETLHLTNTPLLFGARLLVVSLLLCVSTLRHTLYEDCLVASVMFIPIRRVRWETISGAVYIPRAKSSSKSAFADRIVLLPKSVTQGVSTVEEAKRLVSQHPYRTIHVNVFGKGKEELFAAFERCLGYRVLNT